MLNGIIKKIVNIMNAISSGNYKFSQSASAYCFVDVSLVGEVEAGEFDGEPDDDADDECEDVDDVGREHPELVDERREDHAQVEHVVEEVVVEQHLKRQRRAHRRLQDPHLRVRDVARVVVDLVLPQI